MSNEVLSNHDHHDAHADGHAHHDTGPMKIFGFWIYILSDLILFASLFATFAVLHNSYAGGVTGKDIFELPYVAVETAALLLSSITYGFAIIGMYKGSKAQVIGWLMVTFAFGAVFIGMEVNEFHHLISEGHGPDKSAFLSAFFTLVGTHGLHVTSGLIWMATMIVLISKNGITPTNKTRLLCLSLFWHFLDVVWICVFTIVYLLGVM
jgi:cytochrome o ubiquinol oxidase subunit 3